MSVMPRVKPGKCIWGDKRCVINERDLSIHKDAGFNPLISAKQSLVFCSAELLSRIYVGGEVLVFTTMTMWRKHANGVQVVQMQAAGIVLSVVASRRKKQQATRGCDVGL